LESLRALHVVRRLAWLNLIPAEIADLL
jgi:hypothetical protein